MVRISAKLKNTRNFIKGLIKQIAQLVNSNASKKVTTLERRLRPIIYDAVYNSPEMEALRGGELAFDVGIPENEDPTPVIAGAVADSIQVDNPNFRAVGNYIRGGLSVKIQPQDFSNLLTQSYGVVVTDKGQHLPWLSWLLTEGDSIIVAEWHVQYGNFGRSGGAHMIPGGAFTIDARYSGTISDNFVTRALERASDDVLDTFTSIILEQI